MTAEFSEAEARKLEAIEAAPAAAESVRERVARALWEADAPLARSYNWQHISQAAKDNYLRMADAALAVLRGPSSDAERAVERCLALADELDNAIGEPDDESEYSSGYASGQWAAADSLRAAVRGD